MKAKKLVLLTFIILNNPVVGHCQQSFQFPEVTKNDIRIEEDFSGATWSPDSSIVYFARYIDIATNDNYSKKVDTALINWLKSFKNTEDLEASTQKMPPPQNDHLYQKTIIYGYNINTKKIRTVSIFYIEGMCCPGVIFFSPSIKDNKILFTTGSSMYSVDLSSGEENKIKSSMSVGANSELQFDEQAEREIRELPERDDTGSGKIYSPDRHSFIEIKSSGSYPKALPNSIGIFHNPYVQLKTWKELGWRGGTPNDYVIQQSNLYQPTEFIYENDLFTPEESEIRNRYDIPSQ